MFKSLMISITFCGGLFFICSKIYNSVKKRNSGEADSIRIYSRNSSGTGQENRENPRIKLDLPLLMFNNSLAGAVPATAGNVSICGAFLKCESPVGIGEKIQVEFLGETRLPIMSADVVWSNSGVHSNRILNRGMGVRFTDVSMGTRKILEQILAEHA